jgi:hypothetical protein
MRSPRALYSDKAPNWALGTINKCRQFETFQDITHVGDSTFLLNYINRCENLRIGPLLFYTASQARRNLRTILLVHTRNHFIPRCSGLDLVVRY